MAAIETTQPLSPSAEQLKAAQAAVSQYDFIRFTLVDMNGVPRGVLLPSDAAARSLKEGIGCPAALMARSPMKRVYPQEVHEHHFGNLQAMPDLSTLHAIAWVDKYRVGQIMAETYWNPTTPQEACTRNMARRMLSKLDNMGLKFYSGMELEFALINPDTNEPVFSGDKGWEMLAQAEYEPWFYDVASNLKKAGVSVETMHLEFFPGGFEITTQPKFGIEAADGVVILKQGIKEMAIQQGWNAYFMATPFLGQLGGVSHFSFSVWQKDCGKNAFWDDTAEDHISELGKLWIAGMIHHAKALKAVCCISTNAYHKPYVWLDVFHATWGIEDRTAMLRVKNLTPEGTYMENRMPTGPYNPYLMMAATIAAGLDGITRKLPCPAPHAVSEDVELPHSLKEALDCLQEDDVMVEALGETFVRWFIQTKTEADLKMIEGVTDEGELIELERKEYAYSM